MYILDEDNSMLSRVASFHNNIINLKAERKSIIYHHAITSKGGQNFGPIRNEGESESAPILSSKKIYRAESSSRNPCNPNCLFISFNNQ